MQFSKITQSILIIVKALYENLFVIINSYLRGLPLESIPVGAFNGLSSLSYL